MTITAISGFVTVIGSGLDPLAGPDTGPGTFVLMANPANSGTYCYVGLDENETVTTTTGYPLSKSLGNQVVVVVGPGGLAELMFLSDTENDDICYFRIAGEGDGVPTV